MNNVFIMLNAETKEISEPIYSEYELTYVAIGKLMYASNEKYTSFIEIKPGNTSHGILIKDSLIRYVIPKYHYSAEALEFITSVISAVRLLM